jgi:hypothetical protein
MSVRETEPVGDLNDVNMRVESLSEAKRSWGAKGMIRECKKAPGRKGARDIEMIIKLDVFVWPDRGLYKYKLLHKQLSKPNNNRQGKSAGQIRGRRYDRMQDEERPSE